MIQVMQDRIEYTPSRKSMKATTKNYIDRELNSIWGFRFFASPSINDFSCNLPLDIRIDSTEEQFNELSNRWKKETAGISSIIHKTVLNSIYMKIIKNGEKFLPFILRDLEENPQEPDDWFIALEHITECNPVPEEDLGYIDKMAKAWINWGKETGKIQ